MAVWTPELAQRTVDTYRSTHGNITWAWRALDYVLKTAWLGTAPPAPFGPVTIGEGYVLLPNGMKMNYQVNCRDPQEGLSYIYEGETHPIYGGRFLENIVQALARIILMNAAMRIWDRGLPFKLQAHDELAWVVPSGQVAEARAIIAEEMTRPPSWGRNIPLGAMVSAGCASYGDAK
jgi:DNA polymerase